MAPQSRILINNTKGSATMESHEDISKRCAEEETRKILADHLRRNRRDPDGFFDKDAVTEDKPNIWERIKRYFFKQK